MLLSWNLMDCLLIKAAEGRQEQAGEPDADDVPRPGWVSEPRMTSLSWYYWGLRRVGRQTTIIYLSNIYKLYKKVLNFCAMCPFSTKHICNLLAPHLFQPCSPISHSAGLSLSVAYRLNQSSSGSLQTELALAQSPLEVSTPYLCMFMVFSRLYPSSLLSFSHLICSFSVHFVS